MLAWVRGLRCQHEWLTSVWTLLGSIFLAFFLMESAELGWFLKREISSHWSCYLVLLLQASQSHSALFRKALVLMQQVPSFLKYLLLNIIALEDVCKVIFSSKIVNIWIIKTFDFSRQETQIHISMGLSKILWWFSVSLFRILALVSFCDVCFLWSGFKCVRLCVCVCACVCANICLCYVYTDQ